MPNRPYHHGNLRAEMLDAAVAAIAESGVSALSMRELARRLGVTHGAAAHHFGDKTGLLTQIAADGFGLLADALQGAWEKTEDFAAVGMAYVEFAVVRPAHFEVMFRPDLYRTGDAGLEAARRRAAKVLYDSVRQVSDAADDEMLAGVAAWAYVHGIATLWRDGNLPARLSRHPVVLTQAIAPYLFQGSAAARRRKRR